MECSVSADRSMKTHVELRDNLRQTLHMLHEQCRQGSVMSTLDSDED